MNVFIVLILTIVPQTVIAATVIKPTILEHGHYSCNVSDPLINYYFNLYGLSSHSKDHIVKVKNENEQFRMHFCRPLIELCDGKPDYAICLQRADGKEIGVGKEPPKVDLKSGKVFIKYVGDKCNETHNYTTNFEAKCDFSMDHGIAVNMEAVHDPLECQFSMILQTAAACTKRKQTRCTVDHESNHYNLSPLTDLDNNYNIEINSNLTVILNVCRSVLFGEHNSVCNFDTAICLIDQSNKTNIKYRSLGNLENSYPIYNRTLRIEYRHGSPCDDEHPNTSRRLRSTITFICDENATRSTPEYTGGAEVCHYKFIWRTVAACSEQLLHNKTVGDNHCMVTNPMTGIEYDLSFVANKTLKSKQMDGEYEITICGSLQNTICKQGSGVCRTMHNGQSGISGGIGNSNLMWRESGPYLNYTDGDSCLEETDLYTIIEFVCGNDNSLEIEEKACSTKILLSTPIVCKKACAIPNDEINFERLISSLKDYTININGTDHLMYSCRSLVPDEYSNCLFGAGICTSTAGGENKMMTEVILGYPDVHSLINNRTVIITYRNGSICKEDKTKRISSQITFVCDFNIHHGTPTFTNYNNCTYYFEWKTQVSCGKVEAVLNNCSLTNELGDHWDLTALSRSTVHHVKAGHKDETFNISICGGKEFCNDSLVCNNKASYGNKINVMSDYADDLIKFQFSNGSKCSDGSHAQSILNLKCNEFTNVGEPVLVWEQECSLEFEWMTNAICKAPNSSNSTNNTNDASDLRIKNKSTTVPVGSIFSIIFIIIICGMLVWFFSNSYRRSQFLRCAHVFVLRYNLGWLPFNEQLDELDNL